MLPLTIRPSRPQRLSRADIGADTDATNGTIPSCPHLAAWPLLLLPRMCFLRPGHGCLRMRLGLVGQMGPDGRTHMQRSGRGMMEPVVCSPSQLAEKIRDHDLFNCVPRSQLPQRSGQPSQVTEATAAPNPPQPNQASNVLVSNFPLQARKAMQVTLLKGVRAAWPLLLQLLCLLLLCLQRLLLLDLPQWR